MKLKITKSEYENLDEGLKALYEKDGDGYKLPVEDLEDTGALKRAKDHEKEARKQAEAKAKEAQAQLEAMQEQIDELKNGDSRKKGDIEALEKSYQKKLADLETNLKSKEETLLKALRKNTMDSRARQLATDLAGENADIMLPHVMSRLGFEFEDGNPNVYVMDENGNRTAETLDDLKNFYFTNDKFAPIVVGSKATGGGAAGSKGRGSPAAKKLSDMTATEEAQFANEHPEEYQKMVAAETA